MNLLLLITGILITCIATYDIIYTIFAPDGTSNISSRISSAVWKFFLLANRLTGSKKILSAAGIMVIVCIVSFWVSAVWIGNVLIFSSAPEAVVKSSNGANANLLERVYYTGYVLSTLGNGDFKAGTEVWEIYTAVLSFFGLMLLSIVVTYIVPVVSALTQRQSMSIYLSSLGRSPQNILTNYWNGDSFTKLDAKLENLVKDIAHHGQLHLSYPVLHYFHNDKKLTSLLIQVVILDEAVTLLRYYVAENKRPSHHSLEQIRIALTSYLESLRATLRINKASSAPQLNIEELVRAGIPVTKPTAEEEDELNKRRAFLKGCIQNSSWTWDVLHQPIEQAKNAF